LTDFQKNTEVSNFQWQPSYSMRMEKWTERHDEDNNCFWQFFECT